MVQSVPIGIHVPLLIVFIPQRHTFGNGEHGLRRSLGLQDFDRTRVGCDYISPVFVKSEGNVLAGRAHYPVITTLRKGYLIA